MKYTWKNRNNPQNSSDLKVCDMEEKKKKPSNLNELSKNFAAQSKAVHVTINCTSCSSLSWNMLQPRHKTSSHNSSIIQMYRTTHIA